MAKSHQVSATQVSEHIARIDALLSQLGGVGGTLREKAGSLTGRLSSQAISDIQQLDYLRENAMQAGGLSDMEQERFARLSDSVLNELGNVSPAASYQPRPSQASGAPVAPMSPPVMDAWGAPSAPLPLAGVPDKLKFVTIPLLILLVLQILSLLALPFLGPIMNAIFGAAATDPESGITASDLGILRMFTGGMLWVSFLFGALWAALIYFTYRAIGQGKSWARIVAIVLGVLNLLSFPIGTILGIIMLIGAFDQEVQRYATR